MQEQRTTPQQNASLNKLFDKISVILMLNLAVSIVTTGLWQFLRLRNNSPTRAKAASFFSFLYHT